MALLVQKFGGTSVGNLERIQAVADKIIATRDQGHQVVVVVSAMSGETDRLINLAKSLAEHPEPREYAALIATGEQVSMALLSIVLNARACPARCYTGGQAQILTDSAYKKARILGVEAQALRHDITENRVAIVAGFQGIDA